MRKETYKFPLFSPRFDEVAPGLGTLYIFLLLLLLFLLPVLEFVNITLNFFKLHFIFDITFNFQSNIIFFFFFKTNLRMCNTFRFFQCGQFSLFVMVLNFSVFSIILAFHFSLPLYPNCRTWSPNYLNLVLKT